MQEEFNKIYDQIRELRLNPEEKSKMKDRLLAFMKLKPVRAGIATRQEYRSNIFSLVSNFARKPMPIILSIIILLTAGTSFAAEKALPGDFLYPVKLEFNEEIRSALTLGEEAKAKWEIRRAERRLEEAEELAAAGRLKAEVSERIRTNFEEHAKRVRERIADFEAKENIDAGTDLSSRFETSLRVHEGVLQRFATTTPIEIKIKEKINELRVEVKARADDEAKIRIKTEQKLSASAEASVKAAAEGRMLAAGANIADVKSYFERVRSKLSTETTARVEAQLAIAAELFVQGQQKLEAGAYLEAFRLFIAADTTTLEARAMIDLNLRLRIEVETRNEGSGGDDAVACIQVITPARNKRTGEVREFPTPCDVPEDWVIIDLREIQCESCTFQPYEQIQGQIKGRSKVDVQIGL